jgi:MFS transporter, UMF1 family
LAATTEIGLYGIILNVVAILGCGVASVLDKRLGSKTVVSVALVMLLVATLGFVSTGPGFTFFGFIPLSVTDSGSLFGTAAEKVYILYGLLVGLSFGPVQASSRSWLARSVAPEEAGRYFGIYALSGRATTFLATGLNTVLIMASGSPRLGMASMLIFFAIGLAILAITPYPADRSAARKA